MSAVEVSLNFDDLIGAVRESSRGRWFLEEYETRLRKSDTGNILAAITKLEAAMATSGPATGDAALVARAKAAITTARSEIASLDQGKAKLSEEARLFAKLAEMARASFLADAPVAAGVNRALRLVDELEQEFGVAPPVAALKPEPFAADAEVFEAVPAPIVAPIKAAVAPAKDIERGAKLTIRKLGGSPETEPTPVETPSPATVQSIVPPEPRQSRVVIIRRKPEDMMELPLLSETLDTASAA